MIVTSPLLEKSRDLEADSIGWYSVHAPWSRVFSEYQKRDLRFRGKRYLVCFLILM